MNEQSSKEESDPRKAFQKFEIDTSNHDDLSMLYQANTSQKATTGKMSISPMVERDIESQNGHQQTHFEAAPQPIIRKSQSNL